MELDGGWSCIGGGVVGGMELYGGWSCRGDGVIGWMELYGDGGGWGMEL